MLHQLVQVRIRSALPSLFPEECLHNESMLQALRVSQDYKERVFLTAFPTILRLTRRSKPGTNINVQKALSTTSAQSAMGAA